MRKIIGLVLGIIFLFGTTLFADGVDNDLDKYIADANKTGKAVLMFVHEDGCPFCAKMDFEFDESDVSKIVKKRFIFVDINKDDDETVKYKGKTYSNLAFVQNVLGINFFPVILFIDGTGEVIYDLVGYRSKDKFIKVLKDVSSGAYKEESFE